MYPVDMDYQRKCTQISKLDKVFNKVIEQRKKAGEGTDGLTKFRIGCRMESEGDV